MINIHVSLSRFSLPYFTYMIANYKKLATTHELNFYAHCMDNCELEARKLTNNVILVPPRYSSEGHAYSINSALKMSATLKEINIIADNDTIMLARGWDSTLERLLDEVGIVGTTFERIGGWSSGSGLRQTYKDKPTVTWFAISSRYDFSHLDTSPAMQTDIPITTEQLSRLYNLPIGYSLFRDTGWQIPKYLDDNAIPFKSLNHEKPTVNAIAVRSNNDYNEEYQLNGVPFVGHQRGSRKRSFRSAPESKGFYDACETYINKLFIDE